MDRISPHRALSLLALPSGFVFAYPFEISSDSMKVGYKMVTFDTGKISNVTGTIYTLTKFGPAYRTFKGKIKNFITSLSAVFDDGRVFVSEKDGSAILFGQSGESLWEGKLTYQGLLPTAIAASGETLWAAYSEKNTLVKYNINSMREELRIGGSSSPFSSPAAIFLAGNKLFVCNEGSKDIWKIDTTDYSTEMYYKFEEKVFDYKFIDKYEIVCLESGIYLL